MTKNTFGADVDEDVTDWGQENVEHTATEIDRLRKLLDDIDTTLQLHGHVDANTDLHRRIQSVLGITP